MNNVLIIGNGFDLYNDLKTKYEDFLDRNNDSKDDIENKIVTKIFNNAFKNAEIGTNSNTGQLIIIVNGYLAVYENMERVKRCSATEYIRNQYPFVEEYGSDKLKYLDLFKKEFREVSKDILTEDQRSSLDEKLVSDEELNLSCFELYLGYLRHEIELIPKSSNIPKDYIDYIDCRNWIDVEDILFNNQFEYGRAFSGGPLLDGNYRHSKNSYNKYRNFIRIFDSDKTIKDDFADFKLDFIEYIKSQQDAILCSNLDKQSSIISNLKNKFEITSVYNFNYSTYLNSIFDKQSINHVNIHGSVEEGNIVFGSNSKLYADTIKKMDSYPNNYNIKYNPEEQHPELTKMHQMLSVTSTRDEQSIGFVNSITFMGHSIDEQDFEYFHTLIRSNSENVVINVIYFTIGDNDNKQELMDSLYKMLNAYERIYGVINTTKMMMENRINFYHISEFESWQLRKWETCLTFFFYNNIE